MGLGLGFGRPGWGFGAMGFGTLWQAVPRQVGMRSPTKRSLTGRNQLCRRRRRRRRSLRMRRMRRRLTVTRRFVIPRRPVLQSAVRRLGSELRFKFLELRLKFLQACRHLRLKLRLELRLKLRLDLRPDRDLEFPPTRSHARLYLGRHVRLHPRAYLRAHRSSDCLHVHRGRVQHDVARRGGLRRLAVARLTRSCSRSRPCPCSRPASLCRVVPKAPVVLRTVTFVTAFARLLRDMGRDGGSEDYDKLAWEACPGRNGAPSKHCLPGGGLRLLESLQASTRLEPSTTLSANSFGRRTCRSLFSNWGPA